MCTHQAIELLSLFSHVATHADGVRGCIKAKQGELQTQTSLTLTQNVKYPKAVVLVQSNLHRGVAHFSVPVEKKPVVDVSVLQ